MKTDAYRQSVCRSRNCGWSKRMSASSARPSSAVQHEFPWHSAPRGCCCCSSG